MRVYLKVDRGKKLQQFFKKTSRISLFDDVPLGGEEDSVEVKVYGDCKTGAKDHLDYAVSRGWVDFERGAKVAGAKFYLFEG